MIETPFSTTAYARFDLTNTGAKIRSLEIDGSIAKVDDGIGMVGANTTSVPIFNIPITKKEIPTLGYEVVFDGRSVLKADGSIAKVDNYNSLVVFSKLVKLWYTGGASDRKSMLTSLGALPIRSYMTWVSNMVALRMGLDERNKLILSWLVGIYYIQSHLPTPTDIHDVQEDIMLTILSRNVIGVDLMSIKREIGTIPRLFSIVDLVNWIKTVLDTPIIESLTPDFIIVVLSNSFFPTYRGTVAAAIEYPPAFLSLLYTTVSYRGYSKTTLGSVVDREAGRKDAGSIFTKGLNYILKGN